MVIIFNKCSPHDCTTVLRVIMRNNHFVITSKYFGFTALCLVVCFAFFHVHIAVHCR